MAGVPYAVRALVGNIPVGVLKTPEPISLKAILEDFQRQLDDVPVARFIENIMQTGASTFVIHCPSPREAEEVRARGLCFRGFQIRFSYASNVQWIKLTRVVYGTSEGTIKSKLSEYGNVLQIRQEKIHDVGISVYSVRLDLKKPIPSRIVLNNYPVNVFYRGQVQQCYRCEQTGHFSKNCPFRRNLPADASSRITGPSVLGTESATTTPAVAVPIVNNGIPVPLRPGSQASSVSTSVEKAPGKRLKLNPPPVDPVVTQDLPPPPSLESPMVLGTTTTSLVTTAPLPVVHTVSSVLGSISSISSDPSPISSVVNDPVASPIVSPPQPVPVSTASTSHPVGNVPSSASTSVTAGLTYQPSVIQEHASPTESVTSFSSVESDYTELASDLKHDYPTYERIRSRAECFPEQGQPDLVDEFVALIPESSMVRWRRTYTYRQPRFAKAAELRPFLDYYDRLVFPLGEVEDLTGTDLVVPTLPSSVKEDPAFPYLLFEKYVLRRFIAGRFSKQLQAIPSWIQGAVSSVESMDDSLYDAYLAYFAFRHPGHLSFIEDPHFRGQIEHSIVYNKPFRYLEDEPE